MLELLAQGGLGAMERGERRRLGPEVVITFLNARAAAEPTLPPALPVERIQGAL